jgi:hypothetical protein
MPFCFASTRIAVMADALCAAMRGWGLTSMERF